MVNRVNPDKARYYAEVIIGKTFCTDHGTTCKRDECMRKYGTETDYAYDYFDDKPTSAEVTAWLVPNSWYVVERKIRKCGGRS